MGYNGGNRRMRSSMFSKRATRQGSKAIGNLFTGLLGAGVVAGKEIGKTMGKASYNESVVNKENKSVDWLILALVSMFIIPLMFLLMRIPLIGEMALMVLCLILFNVVSEGYSILKDIGVIKKLLILLSVWSYSFIVAHIIEDYIYLVLILSFVPVLCFVFGYMNGWYKNRKIK